VGDPWTNVRVEPLTRFIDAAPELSSMTMPIAKRCLDVLVASLLLVLVSPILLCAAIGIKLTSRGPVLYRARRIGRDRRRLRGDGPGSRQVPERRQGGYGGVEFTLYKFRTMRVASHPGEPITSRNDSRIFPFGAFLRATKIDELPQLFNIIRGDMAFVGPRPEALEIVRRHYTPDDILTLQVTPGVTSPGTLYYYTHFDSTQAGNATDFYTRRFLPTKLAIERVYLRRATLAYDLNIILRTLMVVAARLAGWRRFPDPPEIGHVHSIRTPKAPDRLPS
jgi:lipopolysaccharide/colanic/teichoic acid biosynthesis glycosyltransferase